jgi:hypothetical protein
LQLSGIKLQKPPHHLEVKMGLFQGLKQRLKPQSSGQAPAPQQSPPPGQHNGQAPEVTKDSGTEFNLVNYKPEQLIQHVENTLSTVHFGMTGIEKYMEWVGELWGMFGPIVLLVGTVGEVFFFIWSKTDQKTATWWVALSVIATTAVLEATFMVVSYKSNTIRNRAESRPSGMTDLDRTKIKRYKIMWFVLGFGVGSGQVAFLLSAMSAGVQNMTWLVIFAVVRTVMTLASDFYTAFVHEQKPTEASEKVRELEERAHAASKLLTQKREEVKIINDGSLELRRVHMEAEIKEDSLRTELTMSKLENEARIESMRTMQEQANTFTRLGTSTMRALFDPDMPMEQREAALEMINRLMISMPQPQQLPPRTRVEEERDL